jgi:hypothetical protein
VGPRLGQVGPRPPKTAVPPQQAVLLWALPPEALPMARATWPVAVLRDAPPA